MRYIYDGKVKVVVWKGQNINFVKTHSSMNSYSICILCHSEYADM